ncbi:unnamed protein product [Staurois parvus]|uniref:Uncharacterized protein n=1 Tax=Staurois parvus TaxID=386267 RepID=A0ABN9B540_9NEOB|nr:unnamed protein product [Staurois parvus]
MGRGQANGGLKQSSTQKGKFCFKDCSPLRIGIFGGRGEWVPKFDRYRLPIARYSLPTAASVTAGCPLRMREKRRAL